MKKSSFIEGTIISTCGIVFCKILGLLYVIPFYAIIGIQGGALYSYAYSIYNFFLSLATGGIPVAISKIISEYNALEYYHTKERAFRIGATLIVGLGILSFLILFLFAPFIASSIVGNTVGGNSKESVTLVIRIISTAILIVPILSVSRGYLQGHKFMKEPSIANIIEQIVRVTVIIFGSYLTVRIFHLSIDTAVGLAVFSATLGSLIAYFYIFTKIKKNRRKLNRDSKLLDIEKSITKKALFKKIVFYALPFIAIDILKSSFDMVDTFTVVRTLTKIGFSIEESENVIGVITTWGNKLNMIVISIAMGMIVSLIPTIASSYVQKDMRDVNKKINQAIQILLLIILPMTIGLSFLAQPVWVIFYGYNVMSIQIFHFFIFQAFSNSFFTIMVNIAQTMNHSKLSLGTLIVAFACKAILNIPMMYLFQKFSIAPYYASIFTTVLIQLISVLYIVLKLQKKHHFRFKNTMIRFVKILFCCFVMVMVLNFIKFFIGFTGVTRFRAMLEIFLYSGVGVCVYFYLTYKMGLLRNIFGREGFDKVMNKLIHR